MLIGPVTQKRLGVRMRGWDMATRAEVRFITPVVVPSALPDQTDSADTRAGCLVTK